MKCALCDVNIENWNFRRRFCSFLCRSKHRYLSRPVPVEDPPAGARWLPLTRGKVAIVDADDFERLTQWAWTCSTNGYAFRAERINGKLIAIGLHREVMGLAVDDPQNGDHISRNRLDCRKQNLRTATTQQNTCNKSQSKNNTSGFKGVTWHAVNNRWRAFIKVDYRQRHLGLFDDKVLAAKAYDQAAREAFGEFAALNFPAAT